MIFIPYIISTFIGYCLISFLFRNWRPFSAGLHIALSIGIGLGVSALINFLTFILIGEYSRFGIIIGNALLLSTLLFLNIRFSRGKPYTEASLKSKIQLPVILFTVSAVGLFFLLTFIANIHPYGEWDAWALWNMKLKFLIFGGKEWKNIFTELHWSTQPDYPLLLVFLNMTPFAFFNNYLLQIPMATAVCLTFTSGLVLFSAVKRMAGPMMALFAFVLLMGNSFFIFQSTSQYSDVLLGLYLLCSFVCISLFADTKDPNYAALLGIFLGLMTFTKNEGIVMVALLSVLFLYYVLHPRLSGLADKKPVLKTFLIFLITASLLTIYFKIFLAPRNRDISLVADFSSPQFNFFNWHGLSLILKKFQKEFLHLHWSYLWIFCGVLIILGCRRIFHRECRVFSLFLVLYFLVLIFIYLTTANFDLSWRLDNTLSRILTYLLPSILYYSFALNYRSDKS